MKYITYIIAAIAVIFAVGAFGQRPQETSKTTFLLDTYVTVTVYGNQGQKAADAAILRVEELEKKLSAFRAESDISRINRAKANTAVAVSDECFFLIEQAQMLSDRTNGAFDITVKPLMDLWGFGTDHPKVPTLEELENARQTVDYRKLLLNREEKTVTLLQNNMALDLGGIAKGYCADEAIAVLKEHGVEHAYVDFGGNVEVLGGRPLGLWERIREGKAVRPFVVGIQDAAASRGIVKDSISASDNLVSVVTSGGYERYFEENGTRYHHIIDPKTGLQPTHSVTSVTVVGERSYLCDGLSTALFVLGEHGADALSDLYSEVLFQFEDGSIRKITS